MKTFAYAAVIALLAAGTAFAQTGTGTTGTAGDQSTPPAAAAHHHARTMPMKSHARHMTSQRESRALQSENARENQITRQLNEAQLRRGGAVGPGVTQSAQMPGTRHNSGKIASPATPAPAGGH